MGLLFCGKEMREYWITSHNAVPILCGSYNSENLKIVFIFLVIHNSFLKEVYYIWWRELVCRSFPGLIKNSEGVSAQNL